MTEQTDPITETPLDLTKTPQDEQPITPAAARLVDLEQRGNGFLVAFQVDPGQKGNVLEIDATSLGILPGHLPNVTPATSTAAALLPYAHIDEDTHTVWLGTGAPSENGAVVTVMVTS